MSTLALDIGGANIKAAHSSGGAWSVPFALWRDPAQLTDRLRETAALAPPFERLLVTMTGELCDCFTTKREGVLHILDATEALAGGLPVKVWLIDGRFGSTAEARRATHLAAASNWQALATLVARLFPTGLSLLIDTGSTTTDIIRCRDGRVDTTGFDDTSRLMCGELVYTGATRTPLMALGPSVAVGQAQIPLMAERFATMADVHMLRGSLPEDAACTDTADNRPLTRDFAVARIERMIGGSIDSLRPLPLTIRALAGAFIQAQRLQIAAAAKRVLNGRRPDRIVVSGSGHFIGIGVAFEFFRGVPREDLSDRIGPEASTGACAYALLQLDTP